MPAIIGEANDVPPANDQLMGSPEQAADSESQYT